MSSVAGEECQRAAGPMRGCARSGGTPLDENTHTCRKNGGSGLERKSADPEEEEKEEEYRGQKKRGVSSSSLLYLVLYLAQREEWRKRAGRRGAWSATPPRRQPEQ